MSIETSLVYIYSPSPSRVFHGCGALVEGGYVATCQHVWIEAQSGDPAEVEIEFPSVREDGVAATHTARLTDLCEGLIDPNPDVVLLKPVAIPPGVMILQLAVHDDHETGLGYVHAFLPSRGIDDFLAGEIQRRPNTNKQRAFRGESTVSYWFEKGSSGSPVFVQNGQQLAGILSASELGANQGRSQLREAFVVPGTTIRACLMRLAAAPVAKTEGIGEAELRPILERLGAQEVPIAEIPKFLMQFVEAAQARGAEPVPASNDGADIEATLFASRGKLAALDAEGARKILETKIREEEEARVRRLVPLLKERAAIERLSFDYTAAKATLAEVIRLDPDDVQSHIDQGDHYVTTGSLKDAERAFYAAAEAAQRVGDDRYLGLCLMKLGDVHQTQGNSQAALASFKKSLAIIERFSESDVRNTQNKSCILDTYHRIISINLLQGDLVSVQNGFSSMIGIVRQFCPDQVDAGAANDKAQTDSAQLFNDHEQLVEAKLKPVLHEAAMRLDRKAEESDSDQDQQQIAALCIAIGDLANAYSLLTDALASYQISRKIFGRLANVDPTKLGYQRDLSASFEKIGNVQFKQGDL